MAYYIHMRDSSFAEPPWPGERRLGPYDERRHAQEQADLDAAAGFDVVGVFTEKQSEARRDGD